MQSTRLANLIAEYSRQKVYLQAEWQSRQKPISQNDAFSLFIKCILSSRTKWEKVVVVVDNLQKNGLLFTGSLAQLMGQVRTIGGAVDHARRAGWIVDDRLAFPFLFWLIDSVKKKSIPLVQNGLGPKDICDNHNLQNLKSLLQVRGLTPEALRAAVKQLKGAGDKQASHFLFSLGFEGYAVIDTHILDELVAFGVIPKKPKNLTSSHYYSIEHAMQNWSTTIGIPLHYLDMLLWR